uniref:DNA RNA Nuclease Sfsa n=1 Tax=Florenciella sp. virus SA2 TaxID=3240092 RepID=A0AB39J8W5_9VIRU
MAEEHIFIDNNKVYNSETPYIIAKIIKRPSKNCKTPYVADICLDEDTECVEHMAHTPALGCCGLTDKESTVYVVEKTNPKICKYSVELSILSNGVIVGCNPKMSETLLELAINKNLFEPLKDNRQYKREKKILNSRFDFWGYDKNNVEFVLEVKTVPLAKYDNDVNSMVSYFPDGYRKSKKEVVSPRALKHIQELEQLKLEKKDKIRSILCFVIQRNDTNYFQPSNDDIIYKTALKKAYDNGVEIIPIVFGWDNNSNCYFMNKTLPVMW